MEQFRPVPGFENQYLISNIGNVFSLHRNRMLKPKRGKTGYLRVTLCDGGRMRNTGVHRLVAEAFIPNTENKPTVNHINEIKDDNRVENLEWATSAEQNTHGTRLKRAREHTDSARRSERMDYAAIAMKHNYALPHMCGRSKTAVYRGETIVGVFNSQTEAAKAAHTSIGEVSACVSGKRKTSHGYSFKKLGEIT